MHNIHVTCIMYYVCILYTCVYIYTHNCSLFISVYKIPKCTDYMLNIQSALKCDTFRLSNSTIA